MIDRWVPNYERNKNDQAIYRELSFFQWVKRFFRKIFTPTITRGGDGFVIHYYKPCAHIKIKDGVMYGAMGTQDVFEGISKTQKIKMRIRNKVWRKLFELNCRPNPSQFVKKLFLIVNRYSPI